MAKITQTEVKQREEALAHVRAEAAKLEEEQPKIAAALKAAKVALDQAQIAVFVARGTEGFEDDKAAAASVKRAQEALDAICEKRDAATERAALLERAEKQLDAEVGKLKGQLFLERMEDAKEELRKRIAKAGPAFVDVIRQVAALRGLDNQPTWEQDLHRALEAVIPTFSVKGAIGQGHQRADGIRAGKTVGEVFP